MATPNTWLTNVTLIFTLEFLKDLWIMFYLCRHNGLVVKIFILLPTALASPAPKLAVTVTFHKSAIELLHFDCIELKIYILLAPQYYTLYPNQSLGCDNSRHFF